MSNLFLQYIHRSIAKHPRIAAIALGGAILAFPIPASACQVVGMFNAGPGAAPTPICAGQGGGYSDGGAHPAEMMYRIVTGIIRIAKRERARSNAAREHRRALEAVPEYQAYMRGAWTYFDSGPADDGSPRHCGATFMKEGKALMLHGSDDPGSMAMLSVIDFDSERSRIPRSVEPQLIEVSLDQTGAPRARVNAFNHELNESGLISFAVPSMQAGVDGLADTLRMRVRQNNRLVFDLEYHSGHEAQSKLRACLGAGK
jgi:hypothetical protein